MRALVDRVDPGLQLAHTALLASLPRPAAPATHRFDDDGVCTRCGFDGAEWHHWKTQTYEGRSSIVSLPLCGGAA